MSTLFTFAHRGEAQLFLKKGGYKPIPFYFDSLYDNGTNFLLITGEGLQKTTEKVAAVCAFYKSRIPQIINLGIAGSLSSELQLGEIYSVRTVYREDEFHSFTSSEGLSSFSRFDCISALNRVVTDEKAEQLGYFAQIVDRELWAIGSCASLFKIPFRSYKLIADRAGSQTDCFDLKKRALSFSEKVYDYFCTEVIPRTVGSRNLLIPEGFYATVSQSKKLESLCRKLALKWRIEPEKVFEHPDLERLKREEKHPKKRTKLLLELLNRELTPKGIPHYGARPFVRDDT